LVHALTCIGHQEDDVHFGFQEVLAQLRQKAVSSEDAAEVGGYILEKWGLNLGVEDVEALFFISEEKME